MPCIVQVIKTACKHYLVSALPVTVCKLFCYPCNAGHSPSQVMSRARYMWRNIVIHILTDVMNVYVYKSQSLCACRFVQL